MKRIISMIICLATVICSFAGCSTLEKDDKGAIIDLYLSGDVVDLDPAVNVGNDDLMKLYSLIFEGLTRLDSKGNWEKALMKDYEKKYDEEAGEYKVEITLNSTKWSDGRTVQAQDVVFAWKRILEPTFSDSPFAGSPASMLFDIKNARAAKYGDVSIDDVGVIAADTYVLEVSFEYAVDLDTFFKTCASPSLVPLREDIVARNADWAKKSSTLVTNGPFSIKQFDHGSMIRIERSAGYYREEDETALDKYVIPWRIVTNYDRGSLEDQLAAFENGDIYYLGDIPLDSRAEYKDKATISDELSTHSYYFNTSNTLFSDARVRRALSMALDRDHIVELVTFARPATGLIPYGVEDASSKNDFRTTADESESLISTTADVEGAKALLKEAKVTRGSFEITVNKDDEVAVEIARYAAEVWNDLGFTVKLNMLGVKVKSESDSQTKTVTDNYGDALKSGDFDVIALDVQMLNTDAFSALSVFAPAFSGGGVDMDSENYDKVGHITGYNSDEYSALIEEIYAIRDDSSARASKLHEAEAKLLEDMPVIPVVFNQDAYMVNKKVISGLEDTFWGTRDFRRVKMKNYMSIKEDYLATETY